MAKLHFKYGVMAASKSAALCIEAHNLRKSGNTYEVLKPIIDKRDSTTEIVSRIKGLREPVLALENLDNYEPKPDTQFILIDEVQFFTTKDIEKLVHIADTTDITIFCWGLDVDSDGQLWPAAAKLFVEANELEHKETVCQMPKCKEMASHHIKFDKDGNIIRRGPQVELGGDGKYKSVCRACFHALYDNPSANLLKYIRSKKLQNIK
jgi:thymidine kinase